MLYIHFRSFGHASNLTEVRLPKLQWTVWIDVNRLERNWRRWFLATLLDRNCFVPNHRWVLFILYCRLVEPVPYGLPAVTARSLMIVNVDGAHESSEHLPATIADDAYMPNAPAQTLKCCHAYFGFDCRCL